MLASNEHKKHKTQVFEPKIEIPVSKLSSFPSDIPDTGHLTYSDDGWILNPRSSFPLTVRGIDQGTAEELKKLLDTGYSLGTYAHARTILPIIFRSNFRCKEIEEYIIKFKPQYLRTIEKMKESSIEWGSASDNDREDLLCDFRNEAIQSLEVRPYCNLETLFEYGPHDDVLDDLVNRFGFEIVQLYLRYSGKVGKINVISADHRDRKGFEKMVELGLAIRGKDIPIVDILGNLKVKDMNELVSDINLIKPFRKKIDAINFLVDLPDIKERISKVIVFRELFQLNPLPNDCVDNNIEIELSKSLNYSSEIATLIAHTYVMGGYSTRDMDIEIENLSSIECYEISPVNDGETCTYCKNAASKKYSKRQYPNVPLHIGCRCSVLAKFK